MLTVLPSHIAMDLGIHQRVRLPIARGSRVHDGHAQCPTSPNNKLENSRSHEEKAREFFITEFGCRRLKYIHCQM